MEILEISDAQAMEIANIVKENFLSVERKTEENERCIKISLGYKKGFIHFLEIHCNGTIGLTKQTGAYGHKLTLLNTLPIIDYLRKEGFEFKY